MNSNITRITRLQVDLPDLDALNQEIEEARGEASSLRERLDDLYNELAESIGSIQTSLVESTNNLDSKIDDTKTQLEDKLASVQSELSHLISQTADDLNQRINSLEVGQLNIQQYYEVINSEKTDIVLPWTYQPGQSQLLVFRNGLLQSSNNNLDYEESAENMITFVVPLSEGETVFVLKLR